MASRPKPPPPTPQATKLTAEEAERGIARITRALVDVKALDPPSISRTDDLGQLQPVNTKVETALDETFAPGSLERNRYADAASIGWSVWLGDEPPYAKRVEQLTKSRQTSIHLLEAAIELLNDRKAEALSSASHASRPKATTPALGKSDKVFVVHGHDDGTKEAVARFISRLGLEPIILHEQPNKGRTVIEKFRDEASEIGFAVVIMTPDDETASGQKRARQNVILELGFFLGSLGPSRVAALVKEPVEKPSDYAGVIYTAIDSGGAWKFQLAKELKAAGYDVDMNKAI